MLTWIKLAFALLKLVNSIIRKIEQSQWEESGYRKAMADELLLIKDSVGLAEKDFEAAKVLTPEERRRRLGEDV